MNEIVAKFDYAEVAPDVADKLHKHEMTIKGIQSKAIFEIGAELQAAHDELANYRNGSFFSWCESIGIKSTSAKNIMAYHDFISQNLTNKEMLEALPKSLIYEASMKSAPAELTQKVLDGEITTHNQWQKEKEAMQKRLAEAEEQAEQAKNEAFAAANDRRRAELRAEQVERSNETLRNQCDAQAKEIQELKDNPTVVETPADPEYIAKLEAEAAKAKAEARKANLDYEMLQDTLEKLDKRGGDAMRERDKYAQMAEEIAGELKQAQELNARLLAERKQSDTETDIAILLATAIRQIDDENLELCVRRILRLNDGEKILRRFKEMADIACIKGD